MVFDTAFDNDGAMNDSTCGPVPVSVSPEKIACPAALVVVLVVPLSVPVPVSTCAVTARPAWTIGFVNASDGVTTGCTVIGSPLTAPVDGCVATASCARGPTVML